FTAAAVGPRAEVCAPGGSRSPHLRKWHWGESSPNLPHQRGFEETVYHLGWGITSMADRWENDCFDPWLRHNGVPKLYEGYCTDIFFDLAMHWIDERRRRDEPFFVYLPTNAAHAPCWVADKYKKPYQGKGPAGFFGMIANLDENLGRLDAFLRKTGLRDNTILIYMNDNGGTAGVNVYNAGLRGRKTQYYEGGHRSAFFFRWPAGGLRRPCDLDPLAAVPDVPPTLIDLCGLLAPRGARFDGTSLAGLLRGTAGTRPGPMPGRPDGQA